MRSNNNGKAWEGIKTLSSYKVTSNLPCIENNQIFANELNKFYSRFDTHDFTKECDELFR